MLNKILFGFSTLTGMVLLFFFGYLSGSSDTHHHYVKIREWERGMYADIAERNLGRPMDYQNLKPGTYVIHAIVGSYYAVVEGPTEDKTEMSGRFNSDINYAHLRLVKEINMDDPTFRVGKDFVKEPKKIPSNINNNGHGGNGGKGSFFGGANHRQTTKSGCLHGEVSQPKQARSNHSTCFEHNE